MKAQARIHAKMNPVIAKKIFRKENCEEALISISIISLLRSQLVEYPYLKRIPLCFSIKEKKKQK